MATDAQKRLWERQMHQEHTSWIESINNANRARARANGGHALVTDPDSGRENMEGLQPGQMGWYDVKDGPPSQRGRRRFYGPGWHGPFPEYSVFETPAAGSPTPLPEHSVLEMLAAGRPPTPQESLAAILDFKAEAHSLAASVASKAGGSGMLQRLRTALHFKPRR